MGNKAVAKYLIHSCQKRKWYVDNYLIPSMLEQGIKRENILVYNDSARLGNLRAFLASADMVEQTSGTWHLQDDIIIASSFKAITEEYDKGIVCGFCNKYSEDLQIGIRPVRDMWYSFPCIRIPNHILRAFVCWVKSASAQRKYRVYIEANKFDDTLFRAFMLENYSDKRVVHNLVPNIVDNVDYLLGGSIINQRNVDEDVNSLYFIDKHLIAELKTKLEHSH